MWVPWRAINLPTIRTVSQWSRHSWRHHSKYRFKNRNVSDFVFFEHLIQELGYNWRCC